MLSPLCFIFTLVLSQTEGGLLGAGTGEGSCAAAPFRSYEVKWPYGCPTFAPCCSEYGYCRPLEEWDYGSFRDCNGVSNGTPLPPDTLLAESQAGPYHGKPAGKIGPPPDVLKSHAHSPSPVPPPHPLPNHPPQPEPHPVIHHPRPIPVKHSLHPSGHHLPPNPEPVPIIHHPHLPESIAQDLPQPKPIQLPHPQPHPIFHQQPKLIPQHSSPQLHPVSQPVHHSPRIQQIQLFHSPPHLQHPKQSLPHLLPSSIPTLHNSFLPPQAESAPVIPSHPPVLLSPDNYIMRFNQIHQSNQIPSPIHSPLSQQHSLPLPSNPPLPNLAPILQTPSIHQPTSQCQQPVGGGSYTCISFGSPQRPIYAYHTRYDRDGIFIGHGSGFPLQGGKFGK